MLAIPAPSPVAAGPHLADLPAAPLLALASFAGPVDPYNCVMLRPAAGGTVAASAAHADALVARLILPDAELQRPIALPRYILRRVRARHPEAERIGVYLADPDIPGLLAIRTFSADAATLAWVPEPEHRPPLPLPERFEPLPAPDAPLRFAPPLLAPAVALLQALGIPACELRTVAHPVIGLELAADGVRIALCRLAPRPDES